MTSSSSTSARSAPVRKATAPTPAPEPVQEVDLLGGLDDDAFSSSTVAKPPPGFTEKALPAVAAAPVQNNVIGIDGETALGQAQLSINFILSADDDFADFQVAPTTPAAVMPSAPAAPKMNLMEMLNNPSTQNRPQSMGFSQSPPMQAQGMGMGMGMNMGMGMGMGGMAVGGMHRPSPSLTSNSSFSGVAPIRPTGSGSGSMMNPATPATTTKPASSANFDDLWSMSLGSKPSTPRTAAGAGTGKKSIKDIQNEKASAGLWGSGPAKPQQPDFGSFGGSTSNSVGGGSDDLLL